MKGYKDINLVCMDFDGVVATDGFRYADGINVSGRDAVGIDFVRTILKIPFVVVTHSLHGKQWCDDMKIPCMWVSKGTGKEIFTDRLFMRDPKEYIIKQGHGCSLAYYTDIEGIEARNLLADVVSDKLSYETTCYIGDDITDLSILEKVGFPVVPADAHEWLMDKITWDTDSPIYEKATILEHDGGAGAVRELCDYILMAHDIDDPMAEYRKRIDV